MLQPLPLTTCWDQPPSPALKLIRNRGALGRRLPRARALTPVPSFFASNFRMVFHALREIVDNEWLAAEAAMLEWGCGLGVASCLWALQGGRAFGIEADQELAQLSNRLAEHFEVDAQFACGNFMPEAGWDRADQLDDISRLVRTGSNGYENCGFRWRTCNWSSCTPGLANDALSTTYSTTAPATIACCSVFTAAMSCGCNEKSVRAYSPKRVR